MNTKKCEHCGFVGQPVHDEYSSLLMDFLVWTGSFVVATITAIIPLVLIGPIFSVWHIVTFRSHRCPKCGNWTMRHISRDMLQH